MTRKRGMMTIHDPEKPEQAPFGPSRREMLAGAMAFSALPMPALRAQDAKESVSHGLSVFGELKYAPDFPHFDHVAPKAPTGGVLSLQIKSALGNQAFDTFNTLNIFVLKGDGAAGIDLTFDSLMVGSADEAGAAYGLVAERVRVSANKLTYRFEIRPQARFHDGSKLTAEDVAFSLTLLKSKGHPNYRLMLSEMVSAEAENPSLLTVKLSQNRSRDLHLVIAGMPIFSKTYWQNRDFEAVSLEAPLGSGPYKVGRLEQGQFIEFERVRDYWAADLPVARGFNRFDRIRYVYYRNRQVAFEAFKIGTLNYHEEFTSRIWATGYDFPAMREGKVKREDLASGAPTGSQGWYFNTRREAFKDPRIREAIGLVFDFEWTNRNIMYSSFRRMTSFFENSPMKAQGLPSPEELVFLEPHRGRLPAEVFREPFLPPVSDGSGNDRTLFRRADDLLRAAGCTRDGSVLKLPNGKPLEIEFLDYSDALQAHSQPFQANLKRLGIEARSRIVDAAQYQRRMDSFDFDMTSRALGGSLIPGDSLRLIYGSEAARIQGGRNIAGIDDPVVDRLVEIIARAETSSGMIAACKALDRVLRAGRYWVAMWYRPTAWIAHWDVFSRPGKPPIFGTGAPATWWYDADKARRIGL
jgi:microcin C transport system substrate-binding protein